jgi:hypothetical protein
MGALFCVRACCLLFTSVVQPRERGPLIIGICVIAFSIEVFNVVYFHQGDGESFRTAHFIAALLGIGLGTTMRKFPNRWENV